MSALKLKITMDGFNVVFRFEPKSELTLTHNNQTKADPDPTQHGSICKYENQSNFQLPRNMAKSP